MGVLKGSRNFYKYDLTDIVTENVRAWLEYGLVEMGAYTNVTYSDASTSGYTKLQLVNDNRYTDGRVYEGYGPSWIWETSVSVPGGYTAPFAVSGIKVNNTFYPSATSGIYSHKIDYKHGRIVFDTPVTSGIVQCQYSFRDVDIVTSDSPKWQTIVDHYQDAYNDIGDLSPSGAAIFLKDRRVWLPTIVIATNTVRSKPLQLGGGEIVTCDVKTNILSDNSFISKRINDVLLNQYEHTLTLYDVETAPNTFNYNGTVASGALTYPQLSSRSGLYFWTFANVSQVFGGEQNEHSDLYNYLTDLRLEIQRYLSTY